MRARILTVLAAVVAAGGIGVGLAPAASACYGDDCPLVCQVIEDVWKPVCRINHAEVATHVDCEPSECPEICILLERVLGYPPCDGINGGIDA